MYSAIIFDIDGTLLDASEGIIKSIIYTMNKYNLMLPDNYSITEFVGPSIQDSCKRIFNMNEVDAQSFANCFRNKYSQGDVFYAQPYDNIYKLLENLKGKNILLGVATYKREDYAIDIIKHFNLYKYFDSICGADNENKLTKTDILKKCLKELSCENKPAVLIGDSCHDGRAANEAGIDFIGVTYGFGFKTKDEIKEFNPVLCAENINDIVEFFENKKSLIP